MRDNRKIIEYGKSGVGKICHIAESVIGKDGNPEYILSLIDISKCDTICKIGEKPDLTEKDINKAKVLAELRFYDKKSIRILQKALDDLLIPQLWEAC